MKKDFDECWYAQEHNAYDASSVYLWYIANAKPISRSQIYDILTGTFYASESHKYHAITEKPATNTVRRNWQRAPKPANACTMCLPYGRMHCCWMCNVIYYWYQHITIMKYVRFLAISCVFRLSALHALTLKAFLLYPGMVRCTWCSYASF